MSVEPAYVPPAGKAVTSGQEIGKKVSTDQYWRDKAQEARAMREYEEEQKNIEAIRNPAQPMEPPIKIGGSINLGNFDLQAQAREATAASEAARKAAEDRAVAAEAEAKRANAELMANTINNLQTTLGSQIQKLQMDIAANKGNAKSIGDQLKEITEISAVLGYVKPEAIKPGPVVQGATDAALSLEILRLQLDDKRKERDFAWAMEKDRRNWQLQLQQLKQANTIAMAEVERNKERDTMFLKAPEIIGNVIARGLMSGKGGGAAAPVQRKAPAPRQPAANQQAEDIESDVPAGVGHRTLTAGVGEAGDIACPECGQSIAVGPTATRAVCANCEYTVDIIRQEGANADSVQS